MKTTKKILLTVLIIVLYAPTLLAQLYEWQRPTQYNEKEVGFVTCKVRAGHIRFIRDGVDAHFANGKKETDSRTTKTDEELYGELYNNARSQYGYSYPNFKLRNFKSNRTEEKVDVIPGTDQWGYDRIYVVTASVVIPNDPVANNNNTTNSNYEKEDEDDLTRALDKALQDIREGSRIAIDQVKVLSGMDKNEYKDQIVEILLDKGYKVVAKEYLEKLYDEQQAQQSGIYNDRTTVKENNFSAVGYYLNVRLTETSLRVQVINVSTGEYDANVTIKL